MGHKDDRVRAIMEEADIGAKALLEQFRQQDAIDSRWPGYTLTDLLRAPGVGTAAALVAAVEEAKSPGVRLVAVVVNGVPGVPRWWWRWAEPVALWLLRRAGFEVCR